MTARTETGAYPQEALDAAAQELGRQCHDGPADPDDIKLASDVLAVVVPIIRADEREQIGKLMVLNASPLTEADRQFARKLAVKLGLEHLPKYRASVPVLDRSRLVDLIGKRTAMYGYAAEDLADAILAMNSSEGGGTDG